MATQEVLARRRPSRIALGRSWIDSSWSNSCSCSNRIPPSSVRCHATAEPQTALLKVCSARTRRALIKCIVAELSLQKKKAQFASPSQKSVPMFSSCQIRYFKCLTFKLPAISPKLTKRCPSKIRHFYMSSISETDELLLPGPPDCRSSKRKGAEHSLDQFQGIGMYRWPSREGGHISYPF